MEAACGESQLHGDVEERLWKKEVVMVSRPQGMPTEANFQVKRSELIFQRPPPAGFLVLKVLWLSVDPYVREIINWLAIQVGQDASDVSERVVLSESAIYGPLRATSISKVLASGDPKFKEGDIVQAVIPASDYALISSGHYSVRKIDHRSATVPLNHYLGVLGIPGLTAWVGINVITQLQSKEEVFISSAAGGVGLLAGQLAKLKGCRVVGSAGTDEKVRMLKELYHFDEAFNYKTEKDLNLTLKRCFPSGFDVYFENVGGSTLEAVLENIRTKGRIIACGMVSQYNKDLKDRDSVRNLMHIIFKSLKIEGFMVGDYAHLWDDFVKEVRQLLQQGKISYQMDILGRGIDEFAKAFVGLMRGDNTGKAIVLVDDGESQV